MPSNNGANGLFSSRRHFSIYVLSPNILPMLVMANIKALDVEIGTRLWVALIAGCDRVIDENRLTALYWHPGFNHINLNAPYG